MHHVTLTNVRQLLATPRQIALFALAAFVILIITGVPTAIVNTPIFDRMTPATWWSYPTWIISAALMGLIAATYLSPEKGGASDDEQGLRTAAGGGLLTTLAVGCPTCNKFVVLAVGSSGATNLWAPLQPILAAASIAVLAWALHRRLKFLFDGTACPVPLATKGSKDPAV